MSALRDIVVNDAMRIQSYRDMANRSVTGCYIYLLIWFAIIIPNKLYVSNAEICMWATLLFLVLSAARVVLLFHFKTISLWNLSVWKFLFYLLIWLPALVWGGLCSLSFMHPDFEPVSLVILIATAGLTGGGVAALVPSRTLTIGLITCLLLPCMATTLLLTDAYNISVSLVFAIYWLGMYSVTRNQHSEYWQSLNYSFIIKKHASELEHLNTLDGLTGLRNRKYFDESLGKELKNASRSHLSIALLLLDIDHFKKINDRYGHLAGDECLRSLSALLKKAVKRETDIIARYGGEEFVVILPDVNTDQAMAIAEKIREAVEECHVQYGGVNISFTVSIGVASQVPLPDFTAEQLIEQADSAMYRAKKNGRNQVCR